MKATEQYFAAFIMLQKPSLTFESLDEIIRCTYSINATVRIFVFSFYW